MSILGTPQAVSSGSNYTAETGSNRLVVIAVITEFNSTTDTLTDVTFGATSANIVHEHVVGSQFAALAVVPESEIPAGSNAISIETSEGSTSDLRSVAYTLEGRSQVAPYGQFNEGGYPTGAVANDWSASVSSNADADAVISVCGGITSRSLVSAGAGFTVDDSRAFGDFASGAASSGSISAGTTTATLNWDDVQVGAWVAGSFDPLGTPTLRKGSQFDVETTLGTVTTATLNAVDVSDHITGQSGTTVSFDGGLSAEITTSGEYTLTLGDGSSTEDITVQVNVVGLPTNTARKDGGLLTGLTDLTLDAVNDSGTVVKQLTGITTDASGVISPIDLSDLSEAVGDTLKISLHSAASDVGVTFEQALELI